MANTTIHEFTTDNFQSTVNDADKPVVVDFWAEWCQPCKAFLPTLQAVADQVGDAAIIGKVDIESQQQLAMDHQITAIPTVLIFKGGEVVKRFHGPPSGPDLADAIQAAG